ncbi:MAG TPA: helix-turn-helix transcriptional regulator [Ktedonobacteraceae bacterium]
MQTYKVDDTTGTSVEDYTQLIGDLLSFGQKLCNQTHRIGKHLCQEVMHATRGKAKLLLPGQGSSTERQFPFPTSVSFPVRFRHRIFGTLEVAPDSTHPASPALPLPVAQLLAHTCGSLLYTLELTAFIEGQCQRLDSQVSGHLTRREREVLELICRGNDQQAIAEQLSIAPATVDTHRKRISEKLGIHSERDIPLAAYRANLFSVLDEPGTVSSALPTRED